jgi:phosphoribosylformylglycinamidine (FGAM) synthase PurS component
MLWLIVLILFQREDANAMVFKKLPSAVLVKEQSYPITYLTTMPDEYGCTYYDIPRIEVSLDEGIENTESTVIHEVLHAMAHEYKIKLPESMVLKLEEALYETLRKNKWKIVIE